MGEHASYILGRSPDGRILVDWDAVFSERKARNPYRIRIRRKKEPPPRYCAVCDQHRPAWQFEGGVPVPICANCTMLGHVMKTTIGRAPGMDLRDKLMIHAALAVIHRLETERGPEI